MHVRKKFNIIMQCNFSTIDVIRVAIFNNIICSEVAMLEDFLITKTVREEACKIWKGGWETSTQFLV